MAVVPEKQKTQRRMKGKNAEKANKAGKDWWGKRPLSGTAVSANPGVMKFWKRLLHKIERKQAKKQIKEQLTPSGE